MAGVDIATNAAPPINMITNVYDIEGNDGKDDADRRKATSADEIRHRTTLYLTLADGTINTLTYTGTDSNGDPAIRCGWGSTLVIDDEVHNLDKDNNIVAPVNGAIGSDVVLSNGESLKQGDPLLLMDSTNPGKLIATGGRSSAMIGSGPRENAGTLIINGGAIEAISPFTFDSNGATGAGIGGGFGGSGTEIIINGGKVTAGASYCGSGIGAGFSWNYPGGHGFSEAQPDAIEILEGEENSHSFSWIGLVESGRYHPECAKVNEICYQTVAGEITINGGVVDARSGGHGNAIGQACAHGACSNKDHVIRVTGGTVLTTVPSSNGFLYALGSRSGYTIVTGGSLQMADPSLFQGIGDTAYGTLDITNWADVEKFKSDHNVDGLPDKDKVFMVEVDLSEEIKKRNVEAGISESNLSERISSWNLSIAGVPQNYGAPARFTDGKLYLWLPADAKQKQIAVDLTYIDENGDEQKPWPLYRNPGQEDVLKQYVTFEAPELDGISKYYDGLKLNSITVDKDHPLGTADGHELTDPNHIRYKYQLYSDDHATPLGPESAEATELPSDAGTLLVTVTSDEHAIPGSTFSSAYWGHRAFAWAEIKVVPSAVASVKATWDDGSEVADPQDPAKILDVEVDATSGIFDDGTPTAATCKAPEGRVQLYVDGKEAGEPVAIVFGDASARAASDAGDGADGDAETPAANARVVTGADGREHTVVSWSFPAGDLMAPGARHTLTARYLPSKNYLPSANPEEEETPESQVAVKPDPTIAPIPKLAKSVANLTHPDGPTQPGDRLRYRIEAANTATGSLWTQVVVTDPLPACLDLDPDSVKLTNTWEALDAKALTQAAAVTASDVGRFSIGAAAGSGRAVLTVPAGAVASLSPAVVEFECVVKEGLDLAGASADDLALGNIAEATGTRPNPDDPDGKDIGPMDPDPSPEATPPGPATVAPADPTEGDVAISKSVENLKHPDGGATEVGDRLRYTVELENRGGADTALYDAVVSDPLPAGIELVPGTIQLAGPASDAEGKLVPDTAYDTASRTLAVAVGDLYGGQKWTLTFECEVTAEAVGADIANIAFAHGTPPSENPGRDPQKPGTEPGEAARPPAADDEPEAASDPVSPPEVLPADPAEGDVSIAKTVANLTHDDGTTHVGDTLRYEIALANSSPGTGWVDAVIRDDVPVGVEPVSGTVVLTLADGTSIEVDDAAYDPATRILAVAVGRLYGGQEARLAFEALVTADAVGADIGNVAAGYGTPPSQRDPDAPELVPGAPFSPAEGWDAYEARQDVQRVRTDPVYPEGVTAQGGVIDDGARPDEAATIRRRLAQTGDALLAAALMPAACALAAGAALLASRRRARRAR